MKRKYEERAKNSQQGGSDEYFLNLYLEEHSGQPPSDGELEQYVFDKQNPSEKVFDELYERAHCSAMIVIPRGDLIQEGELNAVETNEKVLKSAFEGRHGEFHLHHVSVSSQSFGYVLIPERYRDDCEELIEAASRELPGCEICFVPSDEGRFFWSGDKLNIQHPSYAEELRDIVNFDPDKSFGFIVHVTRSQVETEETRRTRGWLRA